MKVQPLYDRVLVQRTESEEKTASGLYIPDTAKEKPFEAIVRAVGPGRIGKDGELVKMQVAEGDRVLFGKYAGTEVSLNGEEHLILKEDDILAIIKD